MSKDGKSRERGEDEEQVSLFAVLAQEYADVLTCFAGLESEETPGPEKINSLRENLFEKVFCYDAAVEMVKWGFEEDGIDSPAVTLEQWAKLTPEEKLGSRREDPWHSFAALEYDQRALWIHLLSDSWDLWHRVERPDSVEDLKDSVFGSLITALCASRKSRRYDEQDRELDLNESFLKARNSAWKVVVQETLKPIRGSNKTPLSMSQAVNDQINFDARTVMRTISFGEIPPWLHDRLANTEQKLNYLIELRKELGPIGITTDEAKVRARLREIEEREVTPTKELVAALLWTSAHLPLCLMTSSSAADAVREILLAGVRRDPASITPQETFRQNFRVMTGTRKLIYFNRVFLINVKRAEIIIGFVIESDQAPDSPANAETGLLNAREDLDAVTEVGHSFLARVERIQNAIHLARYSLLKVRDENIEMEMDAAKIGAAQLRLKQEFGLALKEHIRGIDRLHEELGSQASRLFRLQVNLKKTISEAESQHATRVSEKIATLRIAADYRNTGLEKRRFRILDLENGMIAEVF
jgi:hypothetical protein